MADLSFKYVQKDLDEVLEALENFMLRFPDLDRETQLFFVLGGMSAGEGYWTPNDIKAVIRYFLPNMERANE